MSDDEVTRDVDPAWLAAMRTPSQADAARTGAEGNGQGGAGVDLTTEGIDAERTTDADGDLVEHVRAAVREARAGLATPPTTAPPTQLPPALEPTLEPAPTPTPEPAPARPGSALPPPVVTAGGAATELPATDSVVQPVADPVPGPSRVRWEPPARLRPAAIPTAAPLLVDRAPRRHSLRWPWVVAAAVIAALAGFAIAVAVSGGDDPAPPPTTEDAPGGSTTAPVSSATEAGP